MAAAMSGSSRDRSAFTRAAAALIRARAWTTGRGMVRAEIGKFATARDVWAPHKAPAGTSTSPIESCSVRLAPAASLMAPSWLTAVLRDHGLPAGSELELAQPDPADAMVLTLGQHEGGPAAGGQHVVDQVPLIDRAPDADRDLAGLFVREPGIAVEVGVRVGERGLSQVEEPRDIPGLDELLSGIDIDGEVEEVADRQAGASVGQHPGGLQDVEALDDEHVRAAHDDLLAGDDVIGQMGVDGRTDLLLAGLDLGHEPEQAPTVIRLRKALALQKPTAFELGIGVEEAIGGHQLDPRCPGPPRQQLTQDTGGGGLAHRHRSGYSDDERGALRLLAQEVRGDAVQALGGSDVEVEQTRQWQVDLLDLGEVESLTKASQPGHVSLGQAQGVVVAQPGPRRTVQFDVRRQQGMGMRRWHPPIVSDAA